MHASRSSMLRGLPVLRPYYNPPRYSLLQPTLVQYSIKDTKIELRGYLYFIIRRSRVMLYVITASTASLE